MKEGSKEQKSILFYIGIGLIGLLIIGVYLYCNVKGKIDDENGYNSINAIIALIALVVNIITIAFVYATYQTQRDTIIMQRKQIEDDKKDVEFNRALDIVYKQLEHTNTKVTYIKNPNNKVLSNLYNKKLLFQNRIQVKTFLNDYHNEIMLYVNIIDRDILTQQQKIQLGQIFILNTSYDLSAIYNDIYNIISSEEDIQDDFNTFIINLYVRNNLLDYYDMSKEKIREKVIEDFKSDILKDIDTFSNLCEITHTIKHNLEYLAGKIL